MNTSLASSINAFGRDNQVSPSDDLLITVTYGQLRALIKEAVQEAIQPLQDEVMELKATAASQGEELAAMRRKLASLETIQEEEINRVCVDMATDRRRLAALEHPAVRQLTARQEDRSKILRALLAAHNGKMLMKEARQIMRMDKGAFSRLVAAMPDHIETKPFSLNKKQSILILKSRLIVDDNDQQ